MEVLCYEHVWRFYTTNMYLGRICIDFLIPSTESSLCGCNSYCLLVSITWGNEIISCVINFIFIILLPLQHASRIPQSHLASPKKGYANRKLSRFPFPLPTPDRFEPWSPGSPAWLRDHPHRSNILRGWFSRPHSGRQHGTLRRNVGRAWTSSTPPLPQGGRGRSH